ncbi:B-cell receptor CD22-like [Xyrauchen texanus]|uniref:B-cell receptor CD22-like n=1 Tax=Xyrauchen texanus TaxID=154827 RepID=UPI00224190D7|nr:B-cell receptor CD22-like [Xyrauchen texanus]
MPCTFKYPPGHQITTVYWIKSLDNLDDDLSKHPEYNKRIEYLTYKWHNCTLKLSDVQKKDAHKYYVRIITNITDGKWVDKKGMTLNVTDLQVESPESVKEGDSVNLTCKSTCNLTDRARFTWWKNTQSLTETNSKLLLQSVRREDAGRYSCAVHGHNFTSHVYLNVTYPPEKVSVSMSGSGEIVLGDSVTLTCSSDSNPPAHIYTWFKVNESSSVGSGQNYSISNFNSSHSGRFYCEAQNEHGSQRSAALSVSVAGGKHAVWLKKQRSVNIREKQHVDLCDNIDVVRLSSEDVYINNPAVREESHDVNSSEDLYKDLDKKYMSSDDVYNLPAHVHTDDDIYANVDAV